MEYYILEASMVKDRPGGGWDYENGAAILIGNNKQCAVITIRHEATGIHCVCNQQYEYWGRFFNSFNIKNISTPISTQDLTPKIIGSWMNLGGSVAGEYIFAANGHFQYIGGYGSMRDIDWKTVELKSSAFQGDGQYTINGDRIVMKKRGDQNDQSFPFRLEKFNKGSSGWKERLILLNEMPADGGKPYQVSYERSEHK
jgi:hypothetical protein